ncbi:MAG: ATP-grasp domain-containing protein [Firmicutes bacterium]|nr:ATP-grasp domain-containing protein [Bacillota bacterium]
MNFVFISPQFPKTYWNFCDRLKRNGVNVLGIGDASYDSLANEVKQSLNEYYYVANMEDYDQMVRALGYFTFKYGKIDWIESNNEYWLEQDARLRTDFNITTGIQTDAIQYFKSKAEMKVKYAQASVPTARSHRVSTKEALLSFIEEVGYPVIAKPENGVGAADTYKIENENDVDYFFETKPKEAYVSEEFITGDICSYDAIIDGQGEPVFESMTVWPPSIADIVNKDLDLAYYTHKDVPKSLKEYGRRTVKAFQAHNRFVHLEFFRLTKPQKNLGEIGDFVALEVNMRPAGGYTPDMMNFAHSVDVYQIWADMVTYGKRVFPEPEKEYFCAYASQKDGYEYVHNHQDILNAYGNVMVMCERMPEMMVRTMGNQMYTVKLETEQEVFDFVKYVHEKK